MTHVQPEQRVIENPTGAGRELVMTDRADALHLSPTLVHTLRHWARVQPGKNAYTFLSGRESPEQLISYHELARTVFGLAAHFRREGLRGERVLLVMRSGLEYIVGFLACTAAGAIAVPLYPPASDKDGVKLRAVVRDCQPKAMLVQRAIEASHGAQLAGFPGCRSLVMEELIAAHGDADPMPLELTPPLPDDLAFLQYTSGSTGDPKGVMVTHRSIVHNNRMVAAAMGNTRDSVIVTWLPLFHDMGLIGMILQSLSLGARAVLMAPKSFVRDPALWLQAVSKYRGTCAGGPNFAYDLCIEKVDDAVIDTLDLSSWRSAFNGAEPIKANTLERFHRRFERAGFRREMFFPCYGLAEATLFVAGGPRGEPPTTFDVQRDAVHRGTVVPAGEDAGDAARIHTLVGMAIDGREQVVKIVDPGSWTVQPDLRVGEVWLQSDSVTRGYWNRAKATADAFHAYTTDTGEGPFLRTGDLGFVRDGRLFITGRIKELIIVNGFNHYPQDIEETVQALSDDFRVHCGAAFSFDDERLGIVQGVARGKDVTARFDELIARIRREVLKVHGVAPAYIALVNPGNVPKTSSGKIQRGEVRRSFLDKQLEVLHAWEAEHPRETPAPAPVRPVPTPTSAPRAVFEQKLAWIREYCATRLNSYLIDERRTLPPYVILDFGNQGLFGMLVPESYGGLGFSTREFLKVMELLGSKDMTLALFVGLNNVLGVRPVLRFGSERLKEQFLPSLARGRELAAFALTELGAGSNPQAIEATAHATGAGYRVSGTKIWSGSAAWSGLMNVFAKNVDANGHPAGITAFAIPQTSPGVRQGPEALTMGLRGMIQNTVFFEDVAVEPWQVLGELGQGMSVAQDTLCYGRLAIASLCLGATRLCVQLMLQYAGGRRVSTGNLLHNPYTRSVLSEAMHQIAGIEALIDGAAARIDAGQAVAPEVLAVCKSVSTEMLWTTVDRTMQLAGGRGYIESNFIPQLFRDARIFRIFEGPTETLNHFVGTSVLRGRPVLRAYLREWLDEDTVRTHYDAVLHPLLAALPGERDASQEDWLGQLMGEYVNHLVLYAAAAGRGTDAATQRWLLERLQAARVRLDSAARAFPALASVDALRALGDAVDREFGRRENLTAMPNTSLDALFTALPGDTRKPAPAEPARRAFTPPPDAPATPLIETPRPPTMDVVARPGPVSRPEVEAFIRQWISGRCSQPVASLGADVEFAMLGLGSVDSIDLGAALSEEYALTVDPSVLFSYPNIRELAGFLLGKLNKRTGSPVAE
ncbi:AMP-binding protein [Corallococcus sp. Z5C101001]|uniref:AMP-binding protein n=1 Tax=Corallococcus sp. Z5C101001 TaxID=2596829 RepID=UPI00117F1914|nr:AMP-binding protein [Corallococcus sp. Z5C101001]TSC31741.1 AMP-binding protein [Corallococcus sp. Z5C101001]